jgi:peptidoglycan/LPS O-acetylase OafA/YrhL
VERPARRRHALRLQGDQVDAPTGSALWSRPAPSAGGPTLATIDALRGVAILAVFAQHLGDRFMPFIEERVGEAADPAAAPWILTVAHHAWWGVDLFFVLSGFSLGLGYVRAFARAREGLGPRPAAGAFYARRAARVVPAFLVAIAVMVAAHPRVIRLPGFASSIAVHLALLQGYVQPGGIVLLGAAWSLTTEAHFYLLLPLLAGPLLDREDQAPWRGYLIGLALCVASWAVRAALHAHVLEPGVRTALLEATQRRWIVSRVDQFTLGALAAALHAELTRTSTRRRIAERCAPAALALAVAALSVAFSWEGARYLSPGGSLPYALMSLVTTAIVLSAALLAGTARRLAAPKPLCALGTISYGVFLYHQLAIGVAGSLLGPEVYSLESLTRNAALGLALSLALGLASWILVERPTIRWAARQAALRREGARLPP